MSNVPILSLPVAISIDGTEYVEIVQAGTSKRAQAALIGSAGAGTVKSVALTMPALFSVTGSPITTTGTLAVTLATQAANRVFVGPSTGADAAPTFRAMVVADLPSMSGGTILANVTGGAATPTAATPTAVLDVLGSTRGNVLTRGASSWGVLSPGSVGQFLATGGAGADASFRLLAITDMPSIGAGTVIANVTGSPAVPTASTPSGVLDVIGSTQGQILYRGASGWAALAPGTSGQALQSGGAGANPSWVTLAGTGTVTSVATGTGLTGGPITASGTVSIAAHGVTYALMQQPIASSLLGNPTGAPADVQEITLGTTLSFSGTTLQTIAGTGDVTWSANSFATTIAPNAVTYAKFQQIAGLSVHGNGTNALANSSALTGTAAQVLRVASDGLTMGFGQVDLTSSAAVAGALPVANGGTGKSSLTAYSVLLAGSTSTGVLGSVGPGTSGHVLTAQGAGAYPVFQSVAPALDIISSTQGSVLYRNASAWVALGVGTAGQVLTSGGAGANVSWTSVAGTGTVTSISAGSGITLTPSPITSTGSVAITTNGVDYTLFRQIAALSVVGNGTNALANGADITGTANQVLRVNSAGNALAFGQVNLASSSAVTGTLVVANGGLGIASGTSGGIPYFSGTTSIASSGALTQYGIVYGGGAGATPVATAAMTDGQVLVGQTGAAAIPKTVSGDATLSAAGALTVSKVNGVSYPSGPSTNTVPVVTGANTITYEAVPVAAGGTAATTAATARSNLGIVGTLLRKTEYTAAGTSTWNKGAGTTVIFVECIAGGGSGGGAGATGASQFAAGGGGGGGEYACKLISSPGASATVVVGAGGTAAAAGASGNAGGDSTYDTTTVVAKAGAGGTVGGTSGSNSAAGGAGGTGGTGDYVLAGSAGLPSIYIFAGIARAGGGGAGARGGGGGLGPSLAAANAGNKAGGGGSGASINQSTAAAAGGAGADGMVVIWEYGTP